MTFFWGKIFHALVVPLSDNWTGSAGQRTVHCPGPTLSHLIWIPPYPSPIPSHPIWRPPCPYPTCPTYSNLSQPVPFGCTTCQCPFPTPFSQIFFWLSHCHSTFRKTLTFTPPLGIWGAWHLRNRCILISFFLAPLAEVNLKKKNQNQKPKTKNQKAGWNPIVLAAPSPTTLLPGHFTVTPILYTNRMRSQL